MIINISNNRSTLTPNDHQVLFNILQTKHGCRKVYNYHMDIIIVYGEKCRNKNGTESCTVIKMNLDRI